MEHLVDKVNDKIIHIRLKDQTNEEQVICFADKFFSKTKLGQRRSPEKVEENLSKFGPVPVKKFRRWAEMFL